MVSEPRKGFDRYWSDRVPGLVEYARYVLNNDTDFNHTLDYSLLLDVHVQLFRGYGRAA